MKGKQQDDGDEDGTAQMPAGFTMTQIDDDANLEFLEYKKADPLDDSSGDGDGSEHQQKEMMDEIQGMFDNEPRDSYSNLLVRDCLSPREERGKHQYVFHLPAMMMGSTHRKNGRHNEHKSALHKTEIRAKAEATRSALEALRARAQSDSSEVHCDKFGLEWPIEPDESRHTRQLSSWGNDMQILAHYLEDSSGNQYPVAILTAGSIEAYHFKHQLQFRLDDDNNHIVRVTTVEFSWTGEHADVAQKFHRVVSGEDSSDLDAVAVLVKERLLDVGRMEQVADQGSQSMRPHEIPAQLFWLCLTISRLSAWHHLLAVGAPTVPAPSPLKMHAIFDDRLQDNSECGVLALMGKGILQLMVAVSVFNKYPQETAAQLRERAYNLTEVSRLAKLMAASPLPHYAARQVANPEDAAEMIEALVGAHFDEADFYAVHQFWKHLLGAKDGELQESVPHLQESWSYKGRTSTYTELHEDWCHQEGAPAFLMLKVLYEDCEMLYRCVGAGPEERKGFNDSWHALTYKRDLHTFASSTLAGSRDLPTKIVKWLRGMRLEALMTGKMKTDAPVLTYEELSEDVRITMEIQDANNGEVKTHIEESVVLCVKYERCNSLLYYVRSDSGGLGYEAAEDKYGKLVRKTLGYSEQHKGLLSNAFPKHILPKKVSTWLMDPKKDLVELLPPPVKDTSTDNATISKEGVTWQHGSIPSFFRLAI